MQLSRLGVALGMAPLLGLIVAACSTDPDANAEQCPKGLISCELACVDLDIHPEHCGECGNACGDEEVCQAGECTFTCVGGTTNCGGSCVDLQSNPQNCGGCGTNCAAGEVCSAGSCTVSCQDGLENCDGSCADLQTSNENCGVCDNACPAGESCQMGECTTTCATPLVECSDACIDTRHDPLHCGDCDVECDEGDTCVDGECQGVFVPFPSASYAAVKSFADDASLEYTRQGLAWDGTYLWGLSGGNIANVNLARYSPDGSTSTTYQLAQDMRTLFTKVDGMGPVLGRAFNESQIREQSSFTVFNVSTMLTGGGDIPSNGSVRYDGTRQHYVAIDTGAIQRWADDGTFVDTIPLTGWGDIAGEDGTTAGIRVVPVAGYYITFRSGTISAWNDKGERLNSTVLVDAGTTFNSHYSISYAQGLFWVVDDAGGTWRGYDIGM